ncbi:hypothetical protein GCM10022243_67660 [Saccharothrix violaceirubra]|uniref:Uncharacterized protein n=1 Tax=Saccharothrix violaceirubra TaxID=413306 RepID=A0A7W7WVF5_9PSEU|nr:S1 family peptidase [Saccharothrix violaceirubra]MBB4965284.1 hypothetical protein [Saccharothrix violaceirubra]
MFGGRKVALAVLIALSVSPTAQAEQPGVVDMVALSETNALLQASVPDSGALGVFFDERIGRFTVVLPPGVSTFVAADGTRPVVRRTATTRAALDTVDRRITELVTRDKALGYEVGSAYDLLRDTLVIQSNAPVEALTALTAGLPVKAEVRRSTERLRKSRQYDPAPHRGGAAISTAAGNCTSAFTVVSPDGDRYLVTAGHCGQFPGRPIGEPVWNTGSGEHLGYFYNWFYPDRDVALIANFDPGVFGHHIYVGGAEGTQKPVRAATDPVPGSSKYCHSGKNSFEQCGQRVVSLEGTLTSPEGTTRSLIAYDKGVSLRSGDSGAPFYWHTDDGHAVVVSGMSIGGKSDGTSYAEKWSLIAQSQGVQILKAP